MRPALNYVQMGKGKPLLLIHGLGGSWQSWYPILNTLSAHRKVIAIDLNGFGETPRLTDEVSVYSLCNEVTTFIMTHNLQGIDVVGSSMGARIALELSRRGGIVGSVVALSPEGFWSRLDKIYFYLSMFFSIMMIRLLQPFMKSISESRIGRKLLLWQFSHSPSHVAPETVLHEMRDYARATSFDRLLFSHVFEKRQQGMNRKQEYPITIVWGKNDRLCFPHQAKRALTLFPKAQFVWMDKCGHFSQWDKAQDTIKIILEATATHEDFSHHNVLPFQRPTQSIYEGRQSLI